MFFCKILKNFFYGVPFLNLVRLVWWELICPLWEKSVRPLWELICPLWRWGEAFLSNTRGGVPERGTPWRFFFDQKINRKTSISFYKNLKFSGIWHIKNKISSYWQILKSWGHNLLTTYLMPRQIKLWFCQAIHQTTSKWGTWARKSQKVVCR